MNNYTPIIAFNELNNGDMELIKNAESILKEIGIHFKASSPYPKERHWDLDFNDEYNKEIYILFKSIEQEDISPIVVIDKILKDNIITIDDEVSYMACDYIDDDSFELADEYESEYLDNSNNEFENLYNNMSGMNLNSITEFNDALKDILSNIANGSDKNKKLLNSMNYDIMNSLYSDEIFTKINIIQQLKDISVIEKKDDKMIEIINTLLLYINDEDIVNSTYNLL